MNYIFKVNIRPRVEGKPVLFEIGDPVDEKHLDASSLAQHIAAGTAVAETSEETVEEAPVVEAPVEEAPVAETSEESVVEKKEAPQGVWNFKKEELEQYEISVLNMMYKQRAEEFGISARVMTNKTSLIKKMTSEA